MNHALILNSKEIKIQANQIATYGRTSGTRIRNRKCEFIDAWNVSCVITASNSFSFGGWAEGEAHNGSVAAMACAS